MAWILIHSKNLAKQQQNSLMNWVSDIYFTCPVLPMKESKFLRIPHCLLVRDVEHHVDP